MKDDNCIFCKLANGEIPTATLYEDEDFRVILDASPASKGHALIIPKEHYANLYELDDDKAAKVMVLAKKMITKLTGILHCDGYNIVQNNNEAAGQTVFHFHLHMIPRYKGDEVGLGWKMGELTEEDKQDILFGIEQGFDFIAASFVRTADCIREIKEMLDAEGSAIKVIAKIENAEGIENLDEIIAVADGIMVARGDMGVEIPAQEVPHIQKEIIRKCNEACKTVITATQMLDSMIRNPRPTRAEVTDVANAVYDGTDAVMLSGETAMGKYPIDALKMMVSIVEETEAYLDYSAYRRRKVTEENMKNISNAVCSASVSTAHDIGADYIIAPSITGFTSMMLSKWRPAARIIGMSPSTTTVRQMMLQWGVTPVWSRRAESTDELIENSLEELKSGNVINSGDLAVITAGIVTYARRHEAATATNIMRVVSVD